MSKEIEFRGKGTYGCVFGKPIPCKYSKVDATKFKGINIVGKVMYSHEDAQKEWDITRKISVIDPDQKYLFYPFAHCKVDKTKVLENDRNGKCTKINKNSTTREYIQLLLPDGEYSLGEYLKKYFGFNNISRINMLQILDKLFKAVKFLIKNKFVHQDIKLDNIVISNKNGIRLVDFGLGVSFESPEFSKHEYYIRNDKEIYNILFSTKYYVNPPEYRCISEYLLENEKYIDKFEISILQAEYKLFNFESSDIVELAKKGIKLPYVSEIYKSLEIGIYSKVQIKEFKEFLIEFFKYKYIDERIKYLNSIEFYKKSDVYSIGVIMITTFNYIELPSKEQNKEFIIEYNNLIRKCMHPSPIHRITIDEVLKIIKEMLKKYGGSGMKDFLKVNARKDNPENNSNTNHEYIFDDLSSGQNTPFDTPTPYGPRQKIPEIIPLSYSHKDTLPQTPSSYRPRKKIPEILEDIKTKEKSHIYYNTRSRSKINENLKENPQINNYNTRSRTKNK